VIEMPNIVKGSKQEQMVVVPYRPIRRIALLCLAILLVTGGIFSAYQAGHRNGTAQDEADQINREQLIAELVNLVAENSSLRSQVALLDRSSVMDRQANDEVQETIFGLRERVAELEQDVLFYRQVMSKDLVNVGLVIGQMDIKKTELPNRFNYKLVMRQQESHGDTYLTGHLNVNVMGTRGQEQVEIPLHELSQDEDQLEIRLRFKYFQNIEGVLELPLGFVPQQIHIIAVETAPMAKTIDSSFIWLVEGD